jgi:hypothetical protein
MHITEASQAQPQAAGQDEKELMRLEQHTRWALAGRTNDDEWVQKHYKEYQEVYARLNEPDGLKGIAAKITCPPLQTISEEEGAAQSQAKPESPEQYVHSQTPC